LELFFNKLSNVKEVEALHQSEVVGRNHKDLDSVSQDEPILVERGQDEVLLDLLAFEQIFI